MSSDYTPSDEIVEARYVEFGNIDADLEWMREKTRKAEFKRWMEEHDRALSERVYEAGWYDGAHSFSGESDDPYLMSRNNPHSKESQ